LGEESDVKCDRLAQHVLATEGRPVPSATMEDFLPPPSFSFLAAPVHRLIPLRSSSRPVGHFRAIASPSALVSIRLDSTLHERFDCARDKTNKITRASTGRRVRFIGVEKYQSLPPHRIFDDII